MFKEAEIFKKEKDITRKVTVKIKEVKYFETYLLITHIDGTQEAIKNFQNVKIVSKDQNNFDEDKY